MLQKITPNLWFDNQAEAAAEFYTTIFKNSKIINVSRYGEAGQDVHGQQPGTAMTVDFELEGQSFLALNGGPLFTFSEAISFIIHCDDQAEVDYYWEKLSAVPEAEQCGWLKDKFGLSWQVVPTAMSAIMAGENKEGSERAMMAMLQMKKLDIAALQAAYDGE